MASVPHLDFKYFKEDTSVKRKEKFGDSINSFGLNGQSF